MRLKIIAGNLIALLAVCVASFLIVRSDLSTALRSEVDQRIVNDQVLFHRSWRLAAHDFVGQVREQANSPRVAGVFTALDESARRRRAMEAANAVAAWFQDPARDRDGRPEIVLITDNAGKVVARDSDLNRLYGRNLLEAIPTVGQTLNDGIPRHDAWVQDSDDKLLHIAVGQIRNAEGTPLGVLLVGYEISNGFAEHEADVIGRDVAFLTADAVYSSSLSPSEAEALQATLFGDRASQTQASLNGTAGNPFDVTLGAGDYVGVTGALDMTPSRPMGFAVLANRAAHMELISGLSVILFLMAFGAFCIIAYSMVITIGFLRPIEDIEEGVLAVINGNHDLRLDIESAELGGLAYRINQLINVFTGVSEGDGGGGGGDWSGAASAAPAAPPAGGGGGGGGGDVVDDPDVAARLAAESEADYLARVYSEYVAAKQAVGEDVSNIPQDRFGQRLKRNGASLAKKHGCKDVRFLVETKGEQVVLKPVLIR